MKHGLSLADWEQMRDSFMRFAKAVGKGELKNWPLNLKARFLDNAVQCQRIIDEMKKAA